MVAPRSAPCLTLTTDFGTRDGFVGVMKGVIAGIASDIRPIDLSHDLPQGDVRAGAFVLFAAAPYFPEGTTHLAVVDPGVGSDRRAIGVQTERATFVGPDNGLLSWALRGEKVSAIHLLENPAWRLEPLSRSFHGRDLFAPAAANLAAGASIEKAGPALESLVDLPWPEPRLEPAMGRIAGEVLHVDRFGNAITNVPATLLPDDVRLEKLRARCGDGEARLVDCYAAVPPGSPLLLTSSSGLYELACRDASFAARYAVEAQSPVELCWD